MIHGLWSEEDEEDDEDEGRDAREVYKLIRAASQEERRQEMAQLLASMVRELLKVVQSMVSRYVEQRSSLMLAHLQAMQAAAAAAMVVVKRGNKRRRVEKEWWVKPRLLGCDKFVAGRMDRDSSLRLFNMTPSTFEWLCSHLGPLVHKSDTNFRSSIPPRQRIAIAIHRLARGSSYLHVSQMFAVGEATVLTCTRQVYAALSSALGHVLAFPTAGAALHRVMAGFQQLAALPNCCGVLDVLNLRIKRPSGPAASAYLDRHGQHSIAAQCLIDCNMRLLSLAVGYPGGADPAKILRQSALFHKVQRGMLLNTSTSNVNSAGSSQWQYVVSDSGDYPLLPWLMVPYEEAGGDDACKAEFNGRVKQAGMVASSAFERLRRWQVLDKAMNVDVDTAVELVVACAILLHNVLVDQEYEYEVDDDDHMDQLIQHEQQVQLREADDEEEEEEEEVNEGGREEEEDAHKIRDVVATMTSRRSWSWTI